MKCLFCKKELDIDKNEIPPTWYGKYTMSGLIEVICPDCLKDPKKEKEWMRGSLRD